MLFRPVVYNPTPEYPLFITAKQYWCPEWGIDPNTSGPDALTLIFLHSTSFHKETWEPTIESIFKRAYCGDSCVKIRCAWSIECPNHGQSARLNEEALRCPPYYQKFGCEKYAQAAHRFLSAGNDRGAKVNFANQRLVGIGHSLGGVAMTILQRLEPLLNFTSVILVEPMLSPQGPEWVRDLQQRLVKSAYERRDVWGSREDALKYLSSRKGSECWDKRVLRLFTEYGLRQHRDSIHVEAPYCGVTLACTREEEATMYRDTEGATKPVEDLTPTCSRIPVHVIFGTIDDFISKRVQNHLIDPNSSRTFASVREIKGAGHLIPQQLPDELGASIFLSLIEQVPYKL